MSMLPIDVDNEAPVDLSQPTKAKLEEVEEEEEEERSVASRACHAFFTEKACDASIELAGQRLLRTDVALNHLPQSSATMW